MTDVVILSNVSFRFQSPNPLDLAELLAERGLEVEVAAPFAPEALVWNQGRGFHCHDLESKGNRQLLAAAVKRVRAVRPKVVIGVNAVGFVVADIARAAGGAHRFVFYALELSLPNEWRRSLAVRWQASRARRCDLVIATGRERAVAMTERFKLPHVPEVIANSPIRAVTRDDALRAAVKDAGGTGDHIVVYAGSLGVPNRLDEAIDAMTHVRGSVTLAVHGFGGSPEEKQRIAASHARAPAGSVVMLPEVPGDRETLIRWISGADLGLVFLDPRADTRRNVLYYTPNKLFDYMAAGLPVVTSDNPGLIQDVDHAGWGKVCDPSRPAAIGAAIDAVLADYDAMQTRTRDLFATTWSYAIQARRSLDIIEGWCRGQSPDLGPPVSH